MFLVQQIGFKDLALGRNFVSSGDFLVCGNFGFRRCSDLEVANN